MSIFTKIGNLFKSKPGGTAGGNLLRGVVSGALAGSAAGGIIATGANVISQQEYDKKNLTDLEYYNRYGQTKAGVVLQEYQQSAANQPIIQAPQPMNIMQNIQTAVVKTWLQKNWYYVAGGVIALGAAIYFLTRKKGRR